MIGNETKSHQSSTDVGITAADVVHARSYLKKWRSRWIVVGGLLVAVLSVSKLMSVLRSEERSSMTRPCTSQSAALLDTVRQGQLGQIQIHQGDGVRVYVTDNVVVLVSEAGEVLAASCEPAPGHRHPSVNL